VSASKGPPPAKVIEDVPGLPAGVTADEANPGLGRRDSYIEISRQASGGLSDDPTESGSPVIDKNPFRGRK